MISMNLHIMNVFAEYRKSIPGNMDIDNKQLSPSRAKLISRNIGYSGGVAAPIATPWYTSRILCADLSQENFLVRA